MDSANPSQGLILFFVASLDSFFLRASTQPRFPVATPNHATATRYLATTWDTNPAALASSFPATIYCAVGDDIQRIDAAEGLNRGVLKGHTSTITCLGVLEDGMLVSGSLDGTVCLWDAALVNTDATIAGDDADGMCVCVWFAGVWLRDLKVSDSPSFVTFV